MIFIFFLRLRWSVGLCCRSQMTSLTPSLCVVWPGSLGWERLVTRVFAALNESEKDISPKITKHLRLSVFSCSCWNQGTPVRARLLGPREHSVRWSAHTGEVQYCPRGDEAYRRLACTVMVYYCVYCMSHMDIVHLTISISSICCNCVHGLTILSRTSICWSICMLMLSSTAIFSTTFGIMTKDCMLKKEAASGTSLFWLDWDVFLY